jgi:hypothetical protein
MQALYHEEFWSDIYHGRPIAVMNRGGQWHVYLDHALQHNMVFATAEQAVRWLTARIDQPSRRSASPWWKNHRREVSMAGS